MEFKYLSACLMALIIGGVAGCDRGNHFDASKAVDHQRAESSAAVVAQKLPEAAKKTLAFAQPASSHWWNNAVTYQIWLRSFYDQDGDGNGDLKGLTEKLPYLQQLGVGAVWLSPIFKSPSYHGYDTVDYFSVNPDYGSLSDFDAFVKKAHEAGIRVVLDLVLNHVSDQHPWFIKSARKEAGFEDFFVWSKSLPANYGVPWSDTPNPKAVWHFNAQRQEWYYGVFGDTQPDLNLKNPAVVEEVKKAAAFWLNKGVDGFRLDAVRYLIEEGGVTKQADTASTLAFLQDFNTFVKSKNADAMLVGEAFAENKTMSRYYNQGKGIDSVFDFSFSMNISSFLDNKNLSGSESERNQLIASARDALWENLQEHVDSGAPVSFYSPFVNNHDLDRITYKANPVAAKLAAELLLISPGTPYIYYGEEIGLPQENNTDDVYRRGIMQWSDDENAGFNKTGKHWLDNAGWLPWRKDYQAWWPNYWKGLASRNSLTVAAQEQQTESLLNVYKKLIALRKQDLVIRAPEKMSLYESTGNAWVAKYSRGTESRLILLNLDVASPAKFAVPEELRGPYKDLLAELNLELEAGCELKPAEIKILSSH